MNLVQRFGLRLSGASVQSLRSFHNEMQPYEPVKPRFTKNRRYGYRSRYHERGLYPRLRDQNNVVKSSYNDFRPRQFDWSEKKALMGQNDYIDILGSDSIKPYEVVKGVPWYLKGFGGNELQMLTRLQVAKQDWKFSRPKKWKEMQGRLDFLYKYFNFRHKPPFLN